MGACRYYAAIGAVRGCTSNGDLINPINYLDWQRAVKIGSFATAGGKTFSASYINKVDLNLARVHESITYGPNQTAAVVCNHLGAKDFFTPMQSDIDTAVLNAANNKDLVACVAMDYMVSPGVNNNWGRGHDDPCPGPSRAADRSSDHHTGVATRTPWWTTRSCPKLNIRTSNDLWLGRDRVRLQCHPVHQAADGRLCPRRFPSWGSPLTWVRSGTLGATSLRLTTSFARR